MKPTRWEWSEEPDGYFYRGYPSTASVTSPREMADYVNQLEEALHGIAEMADMGDYRGAVDIPVLTMKVYTLQEKAWKYEELKD